MDDGHSRRGDDPALHGHARHESRRNPGHHAGAHGTRRQFDCCLSGGDARRLGTPAAHDGDRRYSGSVPDTGGDPGERDDQRARRVSLRRLLETRDSRSCACTSSSPLTLLCWSDVSKVVRYRAPPWHSAKGRGRAASSGCLSCVGEWPPALRREVVSQAGRWPFD